MSVFTKIKSVFVNKELAEAFKINAVKWMFIKMLIAVTIISAYGSYTIDTLKQQLEYSASCATPFAACQEITYNNTERDIEYLRLCAAVYGFDSNMSSLRAQLLYTVRTKYTVRAIMEGQYPADVRAFVRAAHE